MELVGDLILVLLAALAGGFLARRIGQPLIVGYILAGVAIGPFTGGLTVSNIHDIEQLAELGVALLLFSLGLELSFRELKPVRLVAVAGGLIQITLTVGLGVLLARVFGWSWLPAVWFGAAISLSSTMVALKTIQAQGRLGTLSSRVMLGILVIQDLAVVPLMIVLPAVSDPGTEPWDVLIATGRAALLLSVIVLVATRVVPRVMSFVARVGSRELFLLSTTAVALGVGYTTWAFGVSLALGAFVAGLVISDSEYAHQALSDVMPLRDLFGMLFFVSVGMLMNPTLIWPHIGALTTIVLVVMLGKGAILAAVVWIFRYRNIVPWAVGLTLFQVGEFAFVLARVGVTSGAISDEVYAQVLNAAIITMALTPVISGLSPWFYARFRGPRRELREPLQTTNVPSGGLADHVIITGAGRVGRGIAEALTHLHLPCVLIELDDRRVEQARLAGLPVLYGDASHPVVLEAAGIGRARAVLVTVPAFTDVGGIVANVQRLRPDVPIVARADSRDAVQKLWALGIEDIASPEFEAAIEMTRQAMEHFNVPAHEILQVASAIRRQQYGLPALEGTEGLSSRSPVGELARQLDFTWCGITADSPFSGRSLGELRIRSTLGVSIVGLIHAGRLTANPDSTARLTPGDLVAVLGTREQITRFERAAENVDAAATSGVV
jgi:CPA2 family monovalent cation:H+ antiporter-2